MKNIKKLLSIVMVLTLVLALGASAFAATVAVNDPGHEYTAYQIFKGKNQAADEGAIGDLDWGADIDSTRFIEELRNITQFKDLKDDASASDVAKILATITDEDKATLHAVAAAAKAALTGDGQKLEGEVGKDIGIGYYLIVDTTANLPEGQVQNDLVLEVTQNIVVTPKRDTPESQKKVKEKNDSTGAESGWQDGADYDIGDHVPFQLKGTLPTNYTSYEKYSVTFHDDQSEGLTFDGQDTVKVYVDGKLVSAGYTVVTSGLEDGCEFEIVIDDVKNLTIEDGYKATNSSDITVEYTSELNEGAKIGSEGNPNKMHMEYTSKFDGSGTTNTAPDVVIVFTFETDVDKTDGEKPLAGAGFTLLKKVDGAEGVTLNEGTAYENTYAGYEIVKTIEAPTGSDFDFKGLDSGEYILVETTVPDGYNKAEDISFTIEAKYDTDSSDPKLTDLNQPDKFKVEMTKSEENGSVTTDGKFTTEVVNNSGVALPETGGIGTTIFYVVGAILVAGAVILLVTRKRVSGAEK